MSERHLVAILTGIIRAQALLDDDAAAMQAIALARGGMGERELADALRVLCWGRSFTPAEILRDVDFALGIRRAVEAQ